MKKYVKIMYVSGSNHSGSNHYNAKLYENFYFYTIEDERICYYCKYEPTTHNIEYYKEHYIKNNLIQDVYSISVVMCDEIVKECYKPNPKEYWLDISYKHRDTEKIEELNKVLSELGFRDLGGSGSFIVDDNTSHWIFDENSPVKVFVREAQLWLKDI